MEKFLWDLQLSKFSLTGEDSRKFLHGQTTADVVNAKEGVIFHTCWLSPVGTLKALLEVKVSNEIVSFVLLAGDEKEVLEGLQKVIFISDKVQINISGKIRRVQEISFENSWKETKPKWLSIDSNFILEYDNYTILNKEQLIEWKIRQGFPNSRDELEGKNNPLELGLVDLIDFDKGCFLGQETMAKVKNIGQLKSKLKIFTSDTFIKPGNDLLQKANNERGFEKVGVVTSIIKKNNAFLGLALIRKKFFFEDHMELLNDCGMVKLSTPIGFNDI